MCFSVYGKDDALVEWRELLISVSGMLLKHSEEFQANLSTSMATAISSTLFGLSIKSVFDSWTALQLAVNQGFGGSDSRAKADWLVFATETWFTENENIESYEVEDFLEQVLNNEFDLLIDDGSLQEVASKICTYYALCQQGRDSDVRQRISKEPKPAIDECKESQEDDSLDSSCSLVGESATAVTSVTDGDSEKTSLPNNASSNDSDMEVEEGWEVVKRSKKR
ncbi:pre-rRNA-processing protein TSR2 homolog isoform X3 [Gigantopelta aegis]|uniref:pre-rRNA-processing protein TSR2 homolog isoform X3 n=1 Tax=Gigantopelta aegis TaxID=1735272 RepID=UPI001B88C1D0|nr:pre-rRNA-processing protein TSR2 homolog isoform X3 [Gigantopelta aegis]